jgi:hypothetical protein
VQELHVQLAERLLGTARLRLGAEELGQLEIEDGEDLEQVVERHPVLALLHPRQVRLLDANLARQLGLRQPALLAQLAQAAADGGHLGRAQLRFLRHSVWPSSAACSTIRGGRQAQFRRTSFIICRCSKSVKDR